MNETKYKLSNITKNLEEKGYSLNYDYESNTIKIRKGLAKIISNSGEGQPRCFPIINEIKLFLDNKELADDLIHEKTHLDIFPYDDISLGILYLGALGFSIANAVKSEISLFNIGLMVLAETFGFAITRNLYSDFLVWAADKLKYNRNAD